jgi:[protein-PII] uridylyltransferase
VVEERRQVARRLCQTRDAQERVDHAPRAYILGVDAASVARAVQLVDPLSRKGDVRLAVQPQGEGTAVLDVAGRDQKGFLAAITRALSVEKCDVIEATVATWGDGGVVDSFVVRHDEAGLSTERLQAAIEQALRRPMKATVPADIELRFDDEGSPWHTRCLIEAPDRQGLLADLAASFSAVGVSVHAARIRTAEGRATDEFALSTRDGSKLTSTDRDALRKALGADIPDAQSAHAMETK